MYNASYQAYYSRVGSGIQRRNLFIGTVDSQSILNQVIGSYAEEIAVPCQQRRSKSSTWSFDHNAYRDRGIVRHLIFIEILHDVPQYHLCLAEFLQITYQREHDPDVPKYGCPEYGTKLSLEHSKVLEAKSDGS